MAKLRTITIENVVGGYAHSNTDNPLRPVEGLDDQYSMSTAIDVFQSNKLGDIAPGNLFTILSPGSTTYTDLPMNVVTGSTNKAWLVGSASNLYKLDLAAFTNDDRYSPGTDVVGGTDNVDVVIFRDQNGTEWIAWSYDAANAGEADLARIRNDGLLTTRVTSWASSLTGSGKLTKGVPHHTWNGPDGLVYCTNGRYLFQHDPVTTTGSHQALDLGSDWVTQAGVAYDNFSAIIGYKKTTVSGANLARSECRLWLWDGFSPDPNFVYPINDNYVSAIKNINGILHIWTEGLENRTRVWIFTGGRVQEVASAFNTSIDSAPRHGAVETFRGSPYWLQNTGDSPNEGNITAMFEAAQGRYGIHEIMHPYTDATNIITGFLKNITAGSLSLFAGVSLNGTNSLVQQSASQYYTPAQFASRLISLPYHSTIKKIILYFSQFGAGASLTTSLFRDYDAVSVGGAADQLNYNITNAKLGAARSYVIYKELPDISSFYLFLTFDHASSSNTAAIVRKIEIYYETTDDV